MHNRINNEQGHKASSLKFAMYVNNLVIWEVRGTKIKEPGHQIRVFNLNTLFRNTNFE